MSLFSLKYLTKTNYLNLLFVAIPISFIAGNTAINVNIVLLILSTFFLYGSSLAPTISEEFRCSSLPPEQSDTLTFNMAPPNSCFFCIA